MVKTAPGNVYFDSSNVNQVDIFSISNEKPTLIKENGFRGVQNWIIEILSTYNAHYDMAEKMELYAQKGSKENYRIKPCEKLARVYCLVNYALPQFAEKR